MKKQNRDNQIFKGKNYIFIFGFPGSGTTIFAKQLLFNLSATLWLEPYYIWRYSIDNNSQDNFDTKDFSKEIIHKIREDFFTFYKKSKTNFLIEKEPRNILNFLLIRKIFPLSKLIFIKKKNLYKNFTTISRKTKIRKKKNLYTDIIDILQKLKEQKFLKFKFKLLFYEIRNLDRIVEYIKKCSGFGVVRWGIKLKINNKFLYIDSSKNFKLVNSFFNKKLNKLNKKSYIIVELEKLASNFDKEYSKVVKFIGKRNFNNKKSIINKKRILEN